MHKEDIRDGISLEEVLSDLHCTKKELIDALHGLWEDCGIAYEIRYDAAFGMDIITVWKLL
jgi:hypothetical protein